jgi:hypothetical protein
VSAAKKAHKASEKTSIGSARMGRPPLPPEEARSVQVMVRLPPGVVVALDEERKRRGRERFGDAPSRSEVIREALIRFLQDRA